MSPSHFPAFLSGPTPITAAERLVSSVQQWLIERIQAVFYEDVGRIKMGDIFIMYATRDLKGFQAGPFLHFWDTWLAK